MKLGLLTAPFPRRSLAQVATWAAGEGRGEERSAARFLEESESLS